MLIGALNTPLATVTLFLLNNTAQKMNFFIKDFLSKCDQIRSKLWIWSHFLEKSLMENFIFCAVQNVCRITRNLKSLNKIFEKIS